MMRCFSPNRRRYGSLRDSTENMIETDQDEVTIGLALCGIGFEMRMLASETESHRTMHRDRTSVALSQAGLAGGCNNRVQSTPVQKDKRRTSVTNPRNRTGNLLCVRQKS